MKTPIRLLLILLFAVALPAAAQEDAPTLDEQALLEEEARLDAEEAALAEPEASATPLPPAADPAPAHPELRPVLDQFGGKAGLDALMETFMAGLLADERTAPFFRDANQKRVKEMLSAQFCKILGGDCAYTGRDMRDSHAALTIDRGHFNALVEVLQVAMDKHEVPFRAQNRLLAVLAPMHREIVTD